MPVPVPVAPTSAPAREDGKKKISAEEEEEKEQQQSSGSALLPLEPAQALPPPSLRAAESLLLCLSQIAEKRGKTDDLVTNDGFHVDLTPATILELTRVLEWARVHIGDGAKAQGGAWCVLGSD